MPLDGRDELRAHAVQCGGGGGGGDDHGCEEHSTRRKRWPMRSASSSEAFSFFALPSLLLQMSPYAEVMLTLARGCPPLDSSMHRLQIPKIFNATNTGILRNGGLNASLTAASCGR